MGSFRTLITAAVICAGISAPAVASDFAAGAEAYDGGRYAKAFATWRALAAKGEVRAQVAIAGMHRSGEGRPVDFQKAALWYRRAAHAGDPIAQLNFAELLETGRGAARSIPQALEWYGRAAAQGNSWAAAQRDRLKKGLR